MSRKHLKFQKLSNARCHPESSQPSEAASSSSSSTQSKQQVPPPSKDAKSNSSINTTATASKSAMMRQRSKIGFEKKKAKKLKAVRNAARMNAIIKQKKEARQKAESAKQ